MGSGIVVNSNGYAIINPDSLNKKSDIYYPPLPDPQTKYLTDIQQGYNLSGVTLNMENVNAGAKFGNGTILLNSAGTKYIAAKTESKTKTLHIIDSPLGGQDLTGKTLYFDAITKEDIAAGNPTYDFVTFVDNKAAFEIKAYENTPLISVQVGMELTDEDGLSILVGAYKGTDMSENLGKVVFADDKKNETVIIEIESFYNGSGTWRVRFYDCASETYTLLADESRTYISQVPLKSIYGCAVEVTLPGSADGDVQSLAKNIFIGRGTGFKALMFTFSDGSNQVEYLLGDSDSGIFNSSFQLPPGFEFVVKLMGTPDYMHVINKITYTISTDVDFLVVNDRGSDLALLRNDQTEPLTKTYTLADDLIVELVDIQDRVQPWTLVSYKEGRSEIAADCMYNYTYGSDTEYIINNTVDQLGTEDGSYVPMNNTGSVVFTRRGNVVSVHFNVFMVNTQHLTDAYSHTTEWLLASVPTWFNKLATRMKTQFPVRIAPSAYASVEPGIPFAFMEFSSGHIFLTVVPMFKDGTQITANMAAAEFFGVLTTTIDLT